jgi:hypothetical protein
MNAYFTVLSSLVSSPKDKKYDEFQRWGAPQYKIIYNPSLLI